LDEEVRHSVMSLESFYQVHSSVDVADDGDLFAGI
jgi:hypothetical protein